MCIMNDWVLYDTFLSIGTCPIDNDSFLGFVHQFHYDLIPTFNWIYQRK